MGHKNKSKEPDWVSIMRGTETSKVYSLLWAFSMAILSQMSSYRSLKYFEISELDFRTGETPPTIAPYFTMRSTHEVFKVANSGINSANDCFSEYVPQKEASEGAKSNGQGSFIGLMRRTSLL